MPEGVKKDDDFWYADKDFNTKKKCKNESANDEYIPWVSATGCRPFFG